MLSDYTPQRVACLQPSATVILQRIGRLDRVVACTKYCVELCPEAGRDGRLIIADSWSAKSEQIRAAQPDFVIASVPYQEKSLGEILKAGVRFLGLAPRTLEEIYADIAVIAGIMDAAQRGQAVIASMQEEIEAIREEARHLKRPRVFCEEWGKPLIASQPWVAELVEAAGGRMIGRPGAQLAVESVRDEDPEVIIAAWCGAGERVPLEKIIETRGWEETRAALSGQVYCIRDEFLNTPAPTLTCGLRALAAAIHPEHFPPTNGMRRIARATTGQGKQ